MGEIEDWHSLGRRKEKAKGGWDCFMSSRIYFWRWRLVLMEWEL
jgi:hypothetical protein